ncbi:MAG: BatA domain-containing protein [Crocinitomicaceae bacterium]
MEFIHPERLWLLSLLLVPIIIHLFHFRRQKVLYFSSLKFIRFIEQENKSTQKLRQLLVLISRCLALIFLVLAFALPIIPLTSGGNKGGKNVLAIYIDNSFSMTSIGEEGELLSEAREMAKRMLDKTPLETRILLFTNKMDGVEQRLLTKMEALSYLDKIEPTSIQRNLDEVINWQKEFLDKEHNEVERLKTRQIVLLSDFQSSTFQLEQLKKDDNANFYAFQILPQDPGNLYIDSVWFATPVHKVGEANELFVRLQNDSKSERVNLELTAKFGSQKRTMFLDIAANEKRITSFPFTEINTGFKTGMVSISDKQLYWDDDFHFAYEVAKNANVLILNNENASTKVAQVFAVEPFYRTNAISNNNYTKDLLNGTNLVVLNGLNEIPSGLSNDLMEFHQKGGSVFVIPGNQINRSDYSNLLNGLELPTLGEVMVEGLKIDEIHYKDPFFIGVFEKENQALNLPNVSKAYRINAASGFQLLDFRNGAPLFVRSGTHSFLLTSALQEDFGNFTSNAIFPTLLLRAGEFSSQNFPLFATIGKDANIPVQKEVNGEQPIKLVNGKTSFIPSTRKLNGQTKISIAGMEAIERLKAGTYFIQNEDTLGLLAVNYDRNESAMNLKSSKEIVDELEKAGIKNITFNSVKDGQSLAEIQIDKPLEYWRTFLLLCLLFVLTEMALIKFWK